jgi:CheY-like chemotaxis protein
MKVCDDVRLHVLVADDLNDAADSLCLLLELWGYEPVVAYDGPSALRAALARPPDVALLDLAMPGMDGLEVARRLRASGRFTGRLLVAVSGHGGPDDVRASLAAGFDRHFLKPVEAEDLRTLLAEYADREVGAR